MCGRYTPSHRRFFTATILLIANLAPAARVAAQAFTFSPGNLSYSEIFDSMGPAGTTLAMGWESTDPAMSVGDGRSNAGGVYNVGTEADADRAFGSLGSGSATGTPLFGASFLNATGSTINSLVFAGIAEQWRTGGSSAVTEITPFEFSFDATTLSDGIWTPLSSFDLVEKLTATTTGSAVNGNLPENQTAISATTAIEWSNGTAMWIRWREIDNAGADGLYAIDNFRLTVTTAAPALYWDLNGAAPGLGGATGTWDTAMSNWTFDPAGATASQPYNSTNAAHFAGAAGSVQIAPAGVVVGGGITFEAPGYVIRGGPLTIGSGPIVVNHSVGVSTIMSMIGGSSGLTKTGIGVLKLDGANNFTGSITINGGSLRISADSNLGDPANDLIFAGGTLDLLSNVALDVGRTLTGSASIVIGSGRTLTVNGTVNVNTLALPAPGTLVLAGPTNAVGTLNLSAPATIRGTGPVAVATGAIASQATGTITWDAPLSLPAGTPQFEVFDGSDAIDFVIDGIVSGLGRLLKIESGTLRLGGNNAGWSGSARLGVAGAGATPGGRIIIAHHDALGSATDLQLQFNDGVLEAETAMTGPTAIPIGLSIGPGFTDGAVFAGAAMEFGGTVQLFKPANTTLQHRIIVNNSVTFAGSFATSTSTGTSTGITLSGAGSLTLAHANNPVTEAFTVEGATFIVNGALAASSVTIKSGALRGRGTVLDLFVGDALPDPASVSPGNGVGMLTAGNVTFDADATLQIEINSTLAVADQLVANGLVSLGDSIATLAITDLGAGILPIGTTFTIIDNQSTTLGTTGLFKDRPHLSSFSLNGNLFEIVYRTGTDLNDVVLQVVPEPSCALLFMLGAATLPRRLRKSFAARGPRGD